MEIGDYDSGMDIQIVKMTVLMDESDMKTYFLRMIRKAVWFEFFFF